MGGMDDEQSKEELLAVAKERALKQTQGLRELNESRRLLERLSI